MGLSERQGARQAGRQGWLLVGTTSPPKRGAAAAAGGEERGGGEKAAFCGEGGGGRAREALGSLSEMLSLVRTSVSAHYVSFKTPTLLISKGAGAREKAPPQTESP